MRHIAIVSCLLVFVLGSGSARADDGGVIVVPPYPGTPTTAVTETKTTTQTTNSCPIPICDTCTPCAAAPTPAATPPARRTTRTRRPVKKPPTKVVEGKRGPAGPAGSEGQQGPAGPKGDDGAPGASSISFMVDEPPGKNCPAGGQRVLVGIDADGNGDDTEVTSESYVCNGQDGKDGGNGRDGYSRIQLNLGTRVASIVSAGRPTGWSLAPELGMKFWVSETVEANVGAAWAPGLDRNMVITGTVCRRGLNSRFAGCIGGQYIGWNLEGGRALWHSGLALAIVKVVAVDTRYVDVSLEAGGGVGFDGYDENMQFSYGGTGQLAFTFKF